MRKAYSWTERLANYALIGRAPCPPQDPRWHYGMDKAVDYALEQLSFSVKTLAQFMTTMRVLSVKPRSTGTGLVARVKWDTHTVTVAVALTESGQPPTPGQTPPNKRSRTLDGVREELFTSLSYQVQVDVKNRHLSDRVGELAAVHLEKLSKNSTFQGTVQREHQYARRRLYEHVEKLVGGWDQTGFPRACEAVLAELNSSAPMDYMIAHQRKKALQDARNAVFHAFSNGATLEDLREVVDEELVRSLLET